MNTELLQTPNSGYPRLEIQFPEHYEYDITATFVMGNDSKPRIRAVIDNRAEGKRMTYIMLAACDSVIVYVDQGTLSNGNDDVDCPSWEAAIDFFMREVDGQLKDMWATPSGHSSFE